MNVLNEKIDKANSICILGHTNPDGDCLGSTLGIYNYIKYKYGDSKEVCVYLEKTSNKFDIMPGFNKICHEVNKDKIYDLCIICDCASRDRVKDFIISYDNSKDKIIIDHHETNNLDCENIILNADAPATCELVFDNLEKEYIDKNVATCLYIGIAHDTGVFRYSSTTRHTLETVGYLLDKGLDGNHLLDVTLFMQTLKQKKITAMIIDRAELISENQVLYSYVLNIEMERYKVNKDEIAYVVSEMREVFDIKLAVFCYELEIKNVFKVSLRSNDERINCADIAKSHNGGGHKKAAGFTLNMSEIEMKKYLDEYFIKYLNNL